VHLNRPETLEGNVAEAFAAFPDRVRSNLFHIRSLIFQVASDTAGVGEIRETLKWGQPSYLTVGPKSGTTIRLGMSRDHRPALFVHCQTSLISEFRDMFEDRFDFEGNRGLILRRGAVEQAHALACCVAQALTYHQRKR
jgi:hypothetical protein